MPSIRLLSLVQCKPETGGAAPKSCKPNSARRCGPRPSYTSEMAVAHLRLSASWLSRIQTEYRNAWALCGAAHLNNLKVFDEMVFDLALPDLSDPSLRGTTTQEFWRPIAKFGESLPTCAVQAGALTTPSTKQHLLHQLWTCQKVTARLLRPGAQPASGLEQ